MRERDLSDDEPRGAAECPSADTAAIVAAHLATGYLADRGALTAKMDDDQALGAYVDTWQRIACAIMGRSLLAEPHIPEG